MLFAYLFPLPVLSGNLLQTMFRLCHGSQIPKISSWVFIVSKPILSQFNREENISRSLVWVLGLFAAKSVLLGRSHNTLAETTRALRADWGLLGGFCGPSESRSHLRNFPAEETALRKEQRSKASLSVLRWDIPKEPPSLELMDSWNRQGLQRQKMGSGQANGV